MNTYDFVSFSVSFPSWCNLQINKVIFFVLTFYSDGYMVTVLISVAMFCVGAAA